ncbi:hypothetical protein [Psychroserpens sp. SPM9]|uniref:hypothetical protein n=1 Tax=Psychroserpens sp. SPM9 TaxID=2975598 RepID=UPI0021A38FC8|nr:hypothetical protein [Psychroserpens sp. SPM9]MDG5490047.1 hypothetical protein [Psychroserpens sp. SPM9]
MKYIYKLIVVLGVMLSITSCDETIDPVIYNGVESENRTFLTFANTTVNLPVTIDDTGSVDLILNSSTVSSTDRVFNINLEAESTADPLTYNLPSTVMIPANSYQGVLTVTGVDNGLVDANVKQIVFSLSDLPDSVDMDLNRIVINVFEICPVPDTYLVGDYALVDSNGNFSNGVVNVRVGPTPTERVFETTFLPGSGVDTVLDVTFTLACNLFDLSNDVDISVSCTAGNPPYYILTSAGTANNGSYSLSSDTVHTINYTEDPFASCSQTSIQNFTLTKL